MIKIIKPGVCTYTKTCAKCGCEFSYDLKDLELYFSTEGICCPCCGNFVHHQTQNFCGFDETIFQHVPIKKVRYF